MPKRKSNKRKSNKRKSNKHISSCGIKYKQDKIVNEALDIWDNRTMDLYLKVMGITLLTPMTLVPLALVLGAVGMNKLNKVIQNRKYKQFGSGRQAYFKELQGKIPIIDETFTGDYLKLIALTSATISPFTLIPLVVAVGLYNMTEKETCSKSQSKNTGGSAALSTMYSRGPINNPDNSWWNGQCLFNQFNENPNDYKPNSELRSDVTNLINTNLV